MVLTEAFSAPVDFVSQSGPKGAFFLSVFFQGGPVNRNFPSAAAGIRARAFAAPERSVIVWDCIEHVVLLLLR